MPTDYSYIGDLYGNPSGLPGGFGNQYGMPSIPGPDSIQGGGGGGGGGILGTGITWQDLLGAAKDAAPYILGGIGTINAISQQNAASDLRKEALGLAREDYASRQPLRDQGLHYLTSPMPSPVDLSSLRDTANPFAPAASSLPQLPSLPAYTPPAPPAAVPTGGGLKTDRPPSNPYYDPAVHGPLKSDRPASNPYFNPDAPYRRR